MSLFANPTARMTRIVKQLLDRFFIKQPRLRRFVTRLLEKDQDRDVNLMGARVRINSIKEHGYLRASRFMGRNSFVGDEVPVLHSLAFLWGQSDAFVDVGSNVGVYCAILARFSGLHPIPFYAFEANPDTYRRLVETVKPLPVETFNCALSDHEGTMQFLSGVVSHNFAAIEDRSEHIPAGARPVAIPCRRLDSFPILGRRIILKVDVEGHEWPVLKGAAKLFEEDRVFACYVDGHEEPRIPEYLRAQGFKLYDGRSLEERPEGDCYALLAVKAAAGFPRGEARGA
jgi:FkbM family methyltransferase